MNRQQALKLLQEKMKNENLRRHCYSVGFVMRALAHYFKEDEIKWEVVGILHDGDYEETKGTPELHTIKMHEWLKKEGVEDKEILEAILSHNFVHTGQNAPKNRLEWSLYCCDELTGLIVAVALVKDKTLASVSVDSVMSKWDKTAFAGGVDRKQIAECEPRLGIPVRQFVEIALTAMQANHEDLGL